MGLLDWLFGRNKRVNHPRIRCSDPEFARRFRVCCRLACDKYGLSYTAATEVEILLRSGRVRISTGEYGSADVPGVGHGRVAMGLTETRNTRSFVVTFWGRPPGNLDDHWIQHEAEHVLLFVNGRLADVHHSLMGWRVR